MKPILTSVSILACGAALLAPRIAAAEEPGIYSYAWSEDRLQSGIGVSTILGGGLTGFTDQNMRDNMSSNVNGLWDLRVTIGSHIPIGVDVSYVGTAGEINSLIGTKKTTLVGTTAEAALRWNVLPHADWNPYAFAGIGWQRYDVTGSGFSLSDTGIANKDNSVVFPMGAGLAYRDRSGFVADLRGTFRANTDSKLVLDEKGDAIPLHTWEASAALGYEF